MEIRNRTTGELTTVSQFKALHPQTSFPKQITPEILDMFGYDPVLNGLQPTLGAYEKSVRDGVEEVDGQWFTKYIAVPMFVDDEDGTAVEKIAAYEEELAIDRMRWADYKGFWKALIRSNTYAALKEGAKTDLVANVLATELISLLGDAKRGDVDIEALQVGIWEVAAILPPELVAELETLMSSYDMGDYTLTQPA